MTWDKPFAWEDRPEVAAGKAWCIIKPHPALPAIALSVPPEAMWEHGDMFAIGQTLCLREAATLVRSYEITEHLPLPDGWTQINLRWLRPEDGDDD